MPGHFVNYRIVHLSGSDAIQIVSVDRRKISLGVVMRDLRLLFTKLLAPLFLLIFISSVLGQTNSKNTPTCNDCDIRACNARWANAVLTHDIRAYREILAEDYESVDPNGNKAKKDEELQSFTQAGPIYRVFSTSQESVRIYGEAAVVTGVLIVKMTQRLGGGSGVYRYVSVYSKHDRSWQMSFIQATPTSAAAPINIADALAPYSKKTVLFTKP
jgi:ketosteroid isomerase-like protein